MNALKGLPRCDPRAKDCVRYLPQQRRYELVVQGQVTATISSFAYTVPARRRKFEQAVRQALRDRESDALVERLFPESGEKVDEDKDS
jgi:hypothetical protein